MDTSTYGIQMLVRRERFTMQKFFSCFRSQNLCMAKTSTIFVYKVKDNIEILEKKICFNRVGMRSKFLKPSCAVWACRSSANVKFRGIYTKSYTAVLRKTSFVRRMRSKEYLQTRSCVLWKKLRNHVGRVLLFIPERPSNARNMTTNGIEQFFICWRWQCVKMEKNLVAGCIWVKVFVVLMAVVNYTSTIGKFIAYVNTARVRKLVSQSVRTEYAFRFSGIFMRLQASSSKKY